MAACAGGKRIFQVCADRRNHANNNPVLHSPLMAQGGLTVMQDLAGCKLSA